jgi:PAS domain S-box-containing protein
VSRQQKQSLDWCDQLLELIHSACLATDFKSALAILLDAASQSLVSNGVSAMWLEGDHLEVLASSGTTAPLPGLILPVSQMGAARAVLDSGRAVMVGDTGEDARWRPVPGEEPVRAWLGVPLSLDSRLIGLLEWTNRKANCYDQSDVERAEDVARYAAPVLYRAQLLDDTRQRLLELVEPRLTPSANPVDVAVELAPVVKEALDFTDARHAFVFLLTDGDDHLRCVSALGDKRDRLRTTVLRGDGTLAGWGSPIARSADWLGSGPSDRERLLGLGIDNALVLPLRAAGVQVGMLGVAEPRRGRAFGQGAIRLMTHLASQASLVVERAYRSGPDAGKYNYEMLLRSSPLGVGVLTLTGEIRLANPALSALLGQPDQSLVGKNLAQFLVPADGRRLLHALEEVAITGQRIQVDARIELSGAEYRHTRMSLAFSHMSNDAGGNIVAIVEDVSSLKILEQERVEHLRELREKHAQLRELDQLKSRFVSNVSHELRTPLAVIKLYATLARKGRPEKQTFYLQTIEQETHRLETMVENVLDLTRLDRRSLSVHKEALSAEEIVVQVLEVYEETASKRGVELRNYVRDGVPTLWADKNHLIQMLTNLLDNALKYTPRGGQVWVSAREIGGDARPTLEIAVGDEGEGIAEEEQERIFERFYRGSNNTPGSTGTGLGLAIVQELMTQHGGKITLTSQVGQGSTFALQFPLEPRDGQAIGDQ